MSVRRGLALTKRELDCQGYHSLCYERTRQCMDNAAVLAVHTGTVALAGVVKNPCVLEFLGLIWVALRQTVKRVAQSTTGLSHPF